MAKVFSVFFLILSSGWIIVSVFALRRDSQREKSIEEVVGLPVESRLRFLSSERLLVRLFGIALWLSSFILIIVPLSLFFFLRPAFASGTICMTLMAAMVLHEFVFRRWLLNRVVNQLEQQSLITKT
jgi:hypothetical protein